MRVIVSCNTIAKIDRLYGGIDTPHNDFARLRMRARKKMTISAQEICVHSSRTKQAMIKHSMQYKIHRLALLGILRQS